MVSFGVKLWEEDVDYQHIKASAVEAEKAGLESIWLYDHFYPLSHSLDKPMFECWTTLSALSRATQRIRLGPLTLCNSYRCPSLVAKMSSTLDVISKGRLEFAIGAGWFEKEYLAFGYQFPKPAARLEQLREAVQIIKMMWTEDKPSFRGKHYEIKGAVNFPKPVQKPHPPLWVGGRGPRLLKLAAELGDGVNTTSCTPEEFKERMMVIDEHCVNIGRDPKSFRRSLHIGLIAAKTEDEARAMVEREKSSNPKEDVGAMSYEVYVKRMIVGSLEQCVEKIGRYVDLGCSYFMLTIRGGDETAGIRLLAEEIAPQFK